jgi:Na+-driven multidrug efflux pump
MGAAAAIAGQNLGAGQPERSRQAVWQVARMGLVIAVVVGSLFLTIPGALLGLFGLTQPDTVRLGTELLAYLSVSGLFITVALTFTGGLQGTGDTRSPLFITLASQFALPIGMLTALQATRPLQPRDIWLAIVLGHALRCVLSVWRFEQGKWKSIEVKLG